MDQNINQNEQANNSMGMSTAGLVVSMVSILVPFMGMTGLIGFVFSIIGLVQAKGKKGLAKIYSILGIIISVVGIAYGIYSFIDALPQLRESIKEAKDAFKII